MWLEFGVGTKFNTAMIIVCAGQIQGIWANWSISSKETISFGWEITKREYALPICTRIPWN